MTESVSRVGVALLNWNAYRDTARCLDSLRRSEYRPACVLVFDNGSEDGSAERLKAEYPEIDLVLGNANLGFSEGNNRAVKHLLDAGMEYVWILNNDTAVRPDCLGKLVRALEADAGLGAVSAKICFMEEGHRLWYVGSRCHPWTFHLVFFGIKEEDTGQYDRPGDTGVLTGCCILVRAEVLRRIGLFHPEFFAYTEDVDWSLRAREAGFRLGYEPRAVLAHRMFGASRKGDGDEAPKSSPRVEYLMARNHFLLIRLHTAPWSVRRGFALAWHVCGRCLPRAIGLILLPSRRAAGWACIRGLVAGWGIRPDPTSCRL